MMFSPPKPAFFYITGRKRNRRFEYTDYVNLFIDKPIEDAE